MENKNTLIAIVLITLIWFGYTLFFPAPPQHPAEPVSPPASTQSLEAAQPSSDSSVSPPPAVEVVAPSTLGVEEVTVDTGALSLVISNQGGDIRHLALNRFGQTSAPDSPRVALVAASRPGTGTLRLTGSDGFGLSSSALYQVQTSERAVALDEGQQGSVVLATRLADGLEVVRTFAFIGGQYDFRTSVRFTNRGSLPLSGSAVLALVNPWDDSRKGSMYEFVGPTVFAGDSLNQEDVKDLGVDGKSFGSDALWTAFEEKYFASVLVPEADAFERMRLVHQGDFVENQVLMPQLALQPGESVEYAFDVFAGPKRVDLLESVGHNIDRLVDFGWFAVIAHPLLLALKFFYSFIGNYGVSIILLTVLIKLLFWPLTQKSYTSMKAMQKLQPKMQQLREKYKNDRERLNRELMELYKTHRVNPLGGCLPMVVQIPVFFALYKVLLFSIELRHAPFIFWLTDLSAKDPYYVTPLVMGASMFIQQKMMPSQMDPNQQKIMMMMPVIFTFMFLNFPSGLVIYWLVNNLLTIGQQYLINRQGAATA